MIGRRVSLTNVLLWLAIILIFSLSSCSQTVEENHLNGDWNVYYYDYSSDAVEHFGGHLSLVDGQYEFIPEKNISPSRLDILDDYLLFVQRLQGSVTCETMLERKKLKLQSQSQRAHSSQIHRLNC